MQCHTEKPCDMLNNPCFLHCTVQTVWKLIKYWSKQVQDSWLHHQAYPNWIVHYLSWFVIPRSTDSVQDWERYTLFFAGAKQWHIAILQHSHTATWFSFIECETKLQTQFLIIFPDFSRHFDSTSCAFLTFPYKWSSLVLSQEISIKQGITCMYQRAK